MPRRIAQPATGDGIVLGLILLLTIISRMFLWTGIPYHWDVAQFALGAIDYNPALHRPHLPGYYLYTRAGRLLMGTEPTAAGAVRAFEVLGLLAALAAVGGTWLLGRLVARTPEERAWTGPVAAMLLLVSPIFWIYSANGESYAPEAAFSVWTCCALWILACNPSPRAGIGAGAAAGMLLGAWLGTRQSGAVLAGPLVGVALMAAVFRPGGIWRAGALLAALASVVALWLPPFLSHFPEPRWSSFRALARADLEPFLREHSIFWGAPLMATLRQSAKALVWLAACLGEAGLAMGAVAVAGIWRRPRLLQNHHPLLMGAAVLAAPPLLFYTLIYSQKPAYWLLILPVIFVVVALGVVAGMRGRRLRGALVGALVIGSLLRFLVPAVVAAPLPVLLEKYTAREFLDRQQEMAAFAVCAREIVGQERFLGRRAVFVFTHDSGAVRWRRLQWMEPQLWTAYLIRRPGSADPGAAEFLLAQEWGETRQRVAPGGPIALPTGPTVALAWAHEDRAEALRQAGWQRRQDPSLGTYWRWEGDGRQAALELLLRPLEAVHQSLETE